MGHAQICIYTQMAHTQALYAHKTLICVDLELYGSGFCCLFLVRTLKSQIMELRGAGGTEGGVMRFFIGLTMLIAGGYLLLQSIDVFTPLWGGGGGRGGLFSVGNFNVTTGYVLIPFIFGVGMIFFNSNNYLGWFLAGASILMLIVGVIANVRIGWNGQLFELIMILILTIGGIGLSMSAVRALPSGNDNSRLK